MNNNKNANNNLGGNRTTKGRENFQASRKKSSVQRKSDEFIDDQLFYDLKENTSNREKRKEHHEKRKDFFEENQDYNQKQASQRTKARNNTGSMTRRKKNRRKQKMKRVQRILILLSVLILILMIVMLRFHKEAIPDIIKSVPDNLNVKKVMNQISGDAVPISKYYIYGTHFNFTGNIKTDKSINAMSLLFMDEKTGVLAQSTDNKASNNLGVLFKAQTTANSDGSINFTLSSKINEGINLEHISNGTYCAVLKLQYGDGSSEYRTLQNNTKENKITYYTITKNGVNQEIDISFLNDKGNTNKNYLQFKVQKATLPDDVYDIAIDAGHGGTDTGAISGKYTEAEFTLSYAKALYKSLTAKGYKVKLTRDGTESSSIAMAYTMYDKNGRVNIANASGAKYCFCLHLNSNDQKLTQGGVQVYTSCKGNTDFAKIIADNLVNEAGTSYSVMETDKTANGVYQRDYTNDEIKASNKEASKKKFTPYNITTDTDYLFMIRELGGIATNAYIDGRNTDYGKNLYYQSNKGVECFLIELGYISINKDLQNILTNKTNYIKALSDSLDEQVQKSESS